MKTNSNINCKEININQNYYQFSPNFDAKKIKDIAESYFENIKMEHQKYLKESIASNIDIIQKNNQEKLLRQIIKYIEYYQKEKNHYLNEAISEASLSKRAKRGAISALLGIGAAVAANHYLQQKPDLVEGVTDIINPIAGVSRLVARTAFSGIIGAACSTLIYKAWSNATKNPALQDFTEFQKDMQKAGFTDEKYNTLSERLVKLFHFRECLLLGLHDNCDVNMREEFKKNYVETDISDNLINRAIEGFFLHQLGKLFDDAFKEIYAIHDHEIMNEKTQSKILTWLKSFFSDEKKRHQFSQELQMEFMNRCVTFLQKEMLEPTFMIKHISFTLLISGIIFACIAIAVAYFFAHTALPIVVTLGVMSFLLGVFITNFFLERIDFLKYSRSKQNRNAIKESIMNIQREQNRLNIIIQSIKETTSDDIKLLKNYNNDYKSGKISKFFGAEDKSILVGYSHSWIRDYASRYRHSKAIEIDLSEQQLNIIITAEEQTALLKQAVNFAIQKYHDLKTEEKIDNILSRTQDYLKNEENHEFIKKYEIVQKIREQILNIISYLTKQQLENSIFKKIKTFYCSPLRDGGLKGQEFEWEHVLSIARKPLNKKDAKEITNLIQPLLQSVCLMNEKLKNYDSAIAPLEGDKKYRRMLCLYSQQNEDFLSCMDHSVFAKKLRHSFDFLYSLNEYSDNNINIESTISVSKEFVIYRMLLLKELSELANPNNINTHPKNKELILQFTKTWLNSDPEVIFDDYRNQLIFNDEDEGSVIIKNHDLVEYNADELLHISSALRVDIAYNTHKMSRKKLLNIALNEWQSIHGEKNIFGLKNTILNLMPSNNADYKKAINESIINTKNFFKFIDEHQCFKMLKLKDCLEKLCFEEKEQLLEKLKQFIIHFKESSLSTSQLIMAKNILEQWHLKNHENIKTSPKKRVYKNKTPNKKKNIAEKNTPSSDRSNEMLDKNSPESRSSEELAKLEETNANNKKNINKIINDLTKYIFLKKLEKRVNSFVNIISCGSSKLQHNVNDAQKIITYLEEVTKNNIINLEKPWSNNYKYSADLEKYLSYILSDINIKNLDELVAPFIVNDKKYYMQLSLK